MLPDVPGLLTCTGTSFPGRRKAGDAFKGVSQGASQHRAHSVFAGGSAVVLELRHVVHGTQTAIVVTRDCVPGCTD